MKQATLIAIISVVIILCGRLFHTVAGITELYSTLDYDIYNNLVTVVNIFNLLADLGILYFFITLYNKQK